MALLRQGHESLYQYQSLSMLSMLSSVRLSLWSSEPMAHLRHEKPVPLSICTYLSDTHRHTLLFSLIIITSPVSSSLSLSLPPLSNIQQTKANAPETAQKHTGGRTGPS